MNKTIYMTYKKNIPNFIFNRWKELNPDYNIEFSMDEDCINFLSKNFNNHIVELFKKIPKGMYKADLWRLCKLYIEGGIYADIDLVPMVPIDSLIIEKNITFYSCLSLFKDGIFQAFMINFSKPRNPLILNFLLSFLLNNKNKGFFNAAYPCQDMYNCIKYNLNNDNILAETKYNINKIKINVYIGSSETNIKNINLYYFPNDIEYFIELKSNPHKDTFSFEIKDNILIVKRIDIDQGWGYNHSCDICILSNESIYLFPEDFGKVKGYYEGCVVKNNNNIIFHCRDLKSDFFVKDFNVNK